MNLSSGRRVSGLLGAAFLSLSVGMGRAVTLTPTVQTLPHSTVVTYLGTTPGWFICDSVTSPAVAVMGWPDARGQSRLTTYNKTLAGTYLYHNYRVGAVDAGAGQLNYPLTPAGPSAAGSSMPNHIGSFNTGMIDHPEQAITPNIVALYSSESSGSCRWALNTRLLGFDSRRSFMITETPAGQLTYQSWDFSAAVQAVDLSEGQLSSTPSLSIVGGSKTLGSNQEVFVFVNKGVTYTVRVARQGKPAGVSLVVSQAGKVLLSTTMTGYTYSVRR